MYCHLDKLWIEKSFPATAYASPLVDSKMKMISGAVGVRQELVETHLSFDDWISWKEETTFGGSLDMNSNRLGLINYYSNLNTKEFGFDYVVNHEFGHLFDFANNLNQFSVVALKKKLRESGSEKVSVSQIAVLGLSYLGSQLTSQFQVQILLCAARYVFIFVMGTTFHMR